MEDKYEMQVIEKAPAKINLGLDIVGKRQDGLHELSMIMMSVDLNDYVMVSSLSEDEIVIETNSTRIPSDSKNDVYKACQLLKEKHNITTGVKIVLEKKIPVCAGMGGGSSNAAATLRALNELWNLNLSLEELAEIGGKIGTDVPYCIYGGCALVSGWGNEVSLLECVPKFWVVLVKPNFGISTRTVFSDLSMDSLSHVDIENLRVSILEKDYDAMVNYMGNSLESISIAKKPFINHIKEKMVEAGADVALMTGSGPTVFAVCRSEKQANRVVNSMRGFCKEVYKVRTL